jgi:hypothetical protein
LCVVEFQDGFITIEEDEGEVTLSLLITIRAVVEQGVEVVLISYRYILSILYVVLSELTGE